MREEEPKKKLQVSRDQNGKLKLDYQKAIDEAKALDIRANETTESSEELIDLLKEAMRTGNVEQNGSDIKKAIGQLFNLNQDYYNDPERYSSTKDPGFENNRTTMADFPILDELSKYLTEKAPEDTVIASKESYGPMVGGRELLYKINGDVSNSGYYEPESKGFDNSAHHRLLYASRNALTTAQKASLLKVLEQMLADKNRKSGYDDNIIKLQQDLQSLLGQ